MPRRKVNQCKGLPTVMGGGGHTILDGKVREGLSERTTFQPVQGIQFPAHSRLEAVR